jgi:hypothetical protein
VTARSDDRRTEPALADGPVKGLLADTEQERRCARAYELVISAVLGPTAVEPLGVLREEAPMAAGSDERGAELSPRDGAQNARPADAKTVC